MNVSTGTGNDTIAGDTTSQSVDGTDTIAAGTGNDTLSLQTDAATVDFDNGTGSKPLPLWVTRLVLIPLRSISPPSR